MGLKEHFIVLKPSPDGEGLGEEKLK